jgi:hypothetical protein
MGDAAIGRVLVASLHQGIADVLPTRLGFYEEWLNAEGLRGGTIGAAPVSAVLSFLRQEGDAYDLITTRAGRYAAEWTVETMPPFRRRMIGAAPAWLRVRVLLRVATGLVRDSCQTSRAVSRIRRGTVRIDLRDSVFCSVREPVVQPLCCFYAAAFARLLELFQLDATASVVACRGIGSTECVVSLALSSDRSSEGNEERAA